ncbi:hypothetical protein GBAR_LOCUS28210, partial [Geodia barretti]
MSLLIWFPRILFPSVGGRPLFDGFRPGLGRDLKCWHTYMYVRVHTFTYVCSTTYLPHNYFHCALSIQFEYCQEMCAVALLIYSTGCRNTEGGLFQHHGHSSHQAVLASLCRQCSNIYTYFCLSTYFHKRDSASAVC